LFFLLISLSVPPWCQFLVYTLGCTPAMLRTIARVYPMVYWKIEPRLAQIIDIFEHHISKSQCRGKTLAGLVNQTLENNLSLFRSIWFWVFRLLGSFWIFWASRINIYLDQVGSKFKHSDINIFYRASARYFKAVILKLFRTRYSKLNL